MLKPAALITQLGGVARGTQLQQFGVSRTTLSREVAAGRIDRLRTGVFAAPQVSEDLRSAAAHGGQLTCTSLLRLQRIWVLPETTEPHVWMGTKGRVHRHAGCACISHFYRGKAEIGPASIERALVHLYRCQGDEAFFAAFESAWMLRRLSTAGRFRIRASLPASARWLVDLARSDAESGLESLLRLRLHILGIALTCQVRIAGVGRVDFLVGARLILEVDGRENHDGETNRHKDLVRDAAASRLGYETLRFDYAQVIHDWPTVQAAILGALRRLRDHA
ncbi:type IV toxin-antitoxin system AbiEi family antitoxin domain-containing protein [Microbacterium sp. LTA6]|uniref:DUF559 domain-containing protein n=1 Tax=unclassified Microbacterium TaxID=2609290 RepID=UPI003138E8B1